MIEADQAVTNRAISEAGRDVVSSERAGPGLRGLGDAPPGGGNRRTVDWDISHGPMNYMILVGAQAASALLSFATVWIATHYLGPTGYGGVVAIIAASQLIMQVSLNWTAVSLSRYGCEEFVEKGSVARTFWGRLTILLANLLLVLATFSWWAPAVSSWLHLSSNTHLLIVLYLIAASFWLHVQQGLQAAKLQRLQGILLALERAILFSLLIGLALASKATLATMVWAYIAGAVGACAVGVWRLRNLIWPVERFNLQLLNRMLLFSLPLLPYSLIGYFSTNYLDAWFIARYLSISELGVYSVAYQLIGMLMQFPLLAGTLLMPLFVTLQVEKQDDRIIRFMRGALPLLTIVWSTLCAVFALVASILLPWIFGSQFQGTAELVWPLMVASAFACPVLMAYGPLSSALQATYVPAVAAAVAAVVNVILNILLIPRFGLPGCAWATAGAYGLSMVAVALLINQRLREHRSWVMQASLPCLFGAAFKASTGDNVVAVLIALVVATLLAWFHRKSVAAGYTLLLSQVPARKRSHPASPRN